MGVAVLNLKARVEYKNRNLETVQVCEYPFQDYVDMISLDLKKIITDVEDLIYMMNGNRPKNEWSEAEIILFNRIKHKILDKAGEVGRLPQCLFDANSIVEINTPASFWDKLFGN